MVCCIKFVVQLSIEAERFQTCSKIVLYKNEIHPYEKNMTCRHRESQLSPPAFCEEKAFFLKFTFEMICVALFIRSVKNFVRRALFFFFVYDKLSVYNENFQCTSKKQRQASASKNLYAICKRV